MSNILHSQDAENGKRPDVLAHVAGNIRRRRHLLGISQSALAERSGMSRRMIVGIESGEANISLSSLDRLAEALGMSFAEIVRSPEATDNRRIESLAWRGDDPESRAMLLGTAPATREAELWLWTLGEGERYPAEADAGAWHEMLFVIAGALRVETAEGAHLVKAGDFLIFTSDRPYVFGNAGRGVVRFVRNVVL
jgi:transcriptional regulator with XRE-family HTH domain